MMNLIRADLYRIVRGKAIYITFAVLLALCALIVITMSPGAVGGVDIAMFDSETGDITRPIYLFVDDVGALYDFHFDGVRIAQVFLSNIDNMIFFILPLAILVASPMFSHGTVKNNISIGMSRTKLYLSQLGLSSILCVVLVLSYIAAGIVLATIIRGFGGPAPDGFWLNIVQTYLAQMVMLLALNAFATFLVFATKRTAIVNGAYIAFCYVPSLIIYFLAMRNQEFLRLLEFDIPFNMILLGHMASIETSQIIQALALGAGMFAVSTTTGIALFSRAEIK